MQKKLWVLPILFLISISYGKGFMNTNERYISTQAEEEKRFKENPNPQKGYRITIRIENAPGEFARLKSFSYYRAPNCTYTLKGPAGAITNPDKDIPIELKKISENQYQGDFYTDALLNEDYYGQGICDWKFNGVVALFSATESAEDTLFSASITYKDLEKKRLETSHLKKRYPQTETVKGYLSSGIKKEAFKPEEYFTFFIEVEEIK